MVNDIKYSPNLLISEFGLGSLRFSGFVKNFLINGKLSSFYLLVNMIEDEITLLNYCIQEKNSSLWILKRNTHMLILCLFILMPKNFSNISTYFKKSFKRSVRHFLSGWAPTPSPHKFLATIMTFEGNLKLKLSLLNQFQNFN